MVNINLATDDSKQSALSTIGGGNFILFVAFFLVLAGYGGLLIWKNVLDKNIQKTKEMSSVNLVKFSDQKAKDVVDFQDRLDIANGLLTKGVNNFAYLSSVEKYIVPGVYINSYKFDDATKTITLAAMGDNYNLIAKQILNFKTASEFSSVFGGQTVFDKEKNKINATIVLTIKQK